MTAPERIVITALWLVAALVFAYGALQQGRTRDRNAWVSHA